MDFPDRLAVLIKQVEAGKPITKTDLQQVAMLQALDWAKIGEDFVRDAVARDRAHTQELVNAGL